MIEDLTTENHELKAMVEKMFEDNQKLAQRVERLEAAHEVSGMQQSETLIRIESVEENLCEIKSEQHEIQDDMASMMIRLESQQMYSRKQTLLVTGEAVKDPTRGEDVRRTVIHLLAEYLGVEGLQPHHICACHRLKNPRVILVRFVSQDDAERTYRARTRPKKKGLLIFESLTSERLSVIHDLRELKKEPGSNVLSYYTQSGQILVRTSDNKEVRPTEIPFGVTKSQIRELCKGSQVGLSSAEILDRFRSIHNPHKPDRRSPSGNVQGVGNGVYPWIKKRTNRTKKKSNQDKLAETDKDKNNSRSPTEDASPSSG